MSDEANAIWEGLRDAASWLFVPADRAAASIEKAVAAKPHAIIIDLEDAVVPTRKVEARETARTALAGIRPAIPVGVRINGLATSWWTDDLAMVIDADASVVFLPKVSCSADVERLTDAMARAVTSRRGSGACPIVPMIETAEGVLHAEEIATASGVVAVALGAEDLAADLGVVRQNFETGLQHVRSHLALACAAARRGALDAPVLAPRDVEMVGLEASQSRGLGLTGKLAIHPVQVAAINAAFDPTDEEIQWARSVVNGFNASSRSGSGVVLIGGVMVDAAVVAAAQRLLARSRLDEDRMRP